MSSVLYGIGIGIERNEWLNNKRNNIMTWGWAAHVNKNYLKKNNNSCEYCLLSQL